MLGLLPAWEQGGLVLVRLGAPLFLDQPPRAFVASVLLAAIYLWWRLSHNPSCLLVAAMAGAGLTWRLRVVAGGPTGLAQARGRLNAAVLMLSQVMAVGASFGWRGAGVRDAGPLLAVGGLLSPRWHSCRCRSTR